MKEADQIISRVPSSSEKYLLVNTSLESWPSNCLSQVGGRQEIAMQSEWGFRSFFEKVFKLDPKSQEGPLLTLGRSMQPGSDQNHFCQPTDVAVDPDTGTIYVSDGYCNSRLVQFSPSGKFITQWGEGTQLDSWSRLLILSLHHKGQEAGHPSFGREWTWPSHSLGYNYPLSEENRTSTCIQLVAHSLFLTHTHTQSLIGGKLLPKSFKLYPNREKICHVFVGKDTNCFTLFPSWFQIFSGLL